jgi:pimeloyl-ACP methyl ester carboxylesterase
MDAEFGHGLDLERAEEDVEAESADLIAADGVRLRLTLWGDAARPPLVMLHGGGANARWWTPLVPRLCAHFRCVGLDFRGHGDSDTPDPEVGAFQHDIDAVAEFLSGARFALIGHSMGAHVALEFAARRDRVTRLVAIEASRGGVRRESRRARLALAARRSYRAREKAIERYRFLPEALAVAEPLRREIAAHSVREEADGRFGYKFDPRWFRLPPAAPTPRSQITAPCLLLRGERSPLLTSEGAQALADEIPNARVQAIAGGGHNLHLECPDATAQALLDHLVPSR